MALALHHRLRLNHFSNHSRPHLIVTGGSGFLGQNVVKFLSSRGLVGTVIDLREPTDPGVMEIFRRGAWSFHQCDFSVSGSLRKVSLPEGPLYLVHIASKVHTSNALTPQVMTELQTQVSGIFPLLDHLSPCLKGVVVTSTIETYGFPKSRPIDETHPTNPFNIYGAVKLTLEYFLNVHCRKKNLPLAIFRLPQIYGPGDTYAKAIPTFIQNCLRRSASSLVNNGSDMREFVHVDDIGLAIYLAIERRGAGIFNITGGRSVSIGETLRLVQKICGTNIPPTNKSSDNKHLQYAFDISKAERELGYTLAVSFEDGLRSEVQWFKGGAA